MPPNQAQPALTPSAFLQSLAARAAAANVFGPLSHSASRLTAKAKDCEADAEYRVDVTPDGTLWVSFVTPDRWLSESIEADLMHTGDHIEELIAEELIEHDFPPPPLPPIPASAITCEHFRSEDRLFTFRTPLPPPITAAALTKQSLDHALRWLLAYESCFRNLGDVQAKPED